MMLGYETLWCQLWTFCQVISSLVQTLRSEIGVRQRWCANCEVMVAPGRWLGATSLLHVQGVLQAMQVICMQQVCIILSKVKVSQAWTLVHKIFLITFWCSYAYEFWFIFSFSVQCAQTYKLSFNTRVVSS